MSCYHVKVNWAIITIFAQNSINVLKSRRAKSTTNKFYKKVKEIGLFLVVLTSPLWLYLGYYLYKEIKAGYIKYQAFGIYIPKKYTVYGIDVSKYQDVINWKSVKKMNIDGFDIDFAFIKATEGTSLLDQNFIQNWVRIKDAKIIRGAYHFFLPHKDAVLQANHFCEKVKLSKGDLPPVIDIETENKMSKEKIRRGLKSWLKVVEKKYQMKPIIYTNLSFYRDNLEGYFNEYPIWVANYSGGSEPKIKKEWCFWQISEAATVNGIRSKVDFNVFNGTKTEFLKLRK